MHLVVALWLVAAPSLSSQEAAEAHEEDEACLLQVQMRVEGDASSGLCAQNLDAAHERAILSVMKDLRRTPNETRWEDHTARFVANGIYTTNISRHWAIYQADLLEALRDARPPALGQTERRLRILIATPVTAGMLETVAFNMEKLQQNHAGDEFDLALFYYQQPAGAPPEMPAAVRAALQPHLALQRAGPGCKAQLWRMLGGDLASTYDYVWLIDGDVRMDYLSWDLYRHLLLDLDPLVSQPSIVGWAPGRRASDHSHLNMKPVSRTGKLPLAHEVRLVEMMAPLVSTRLWPALYQRLSLIAGASAWSVEGFWNQVVYAAKEAGCAATHPLVINVAPLRHANCHDLKRTGRCITDWDPRDCYNVTATEAALLAAAFPNRTTGPPGACPSGAEVWENICVCECPTSWKTPQDVVLRQWVAPALSLQT